jgi:hypothetical protein
MLQAMPIEQYHVYEGGGITSVMFTGRKILDRSPQDVGR